MFTRKRVVLLWVVLGVFALGVWLGAAKISGGSAAWAQQTGDTRVVRRGNVGVIKGYRVTLLSEIAWPEDDEVLEVFVVDSTQSFGLRFEDHIAVYRISEARKVVPLPNKGGPVSVPSTIPEP